MEKLKTSCFHAQMRLSHAVYDEFISSYVYVCACVRVCAFVFKKTGITLHLFYQHITISVLKRQTAVYFEF